MDPPALFAPPCPGHSPFPPQCGFPSLKAPSQEMCLSRKQEAASDFSSAATKQPREKHSPDRSRARARGANSRRPSAAVSFAEINSPSFPRTLSGQHSQWPGPLQAPSRLSVPNPTREAQSSKAMRRQAVEATRRPSQEPHPKPPTRRAVWTSPEAAPPPAFLPALVPQTRPGGKVQRQPDSQSRFAPALVPNKRTAQGHYG